MQEKTNNVLTTRAETHSIQKEIEAVEERIKKTQETNRELAAAYEKQRKVYEGLVAKGT